MNERLSRISRGGGALLVAFIALTAGACSSKSGGVAVTNQPTPTLVATTLPASAQTPSTSPTPAPPVEGTWETAHLSETDVVSAYVAAGGTKKDGREFFQGLGNASAGTKYDVITLKFSGGTLAEFSSGNGNAAQQGYFGSYELVGSNEVRITDDPRDSQCVFTLRYVRQGNILVLHYAGDNHHCSKPIEVPGPTDPAGPTIFGSFPFTLVA